LTALGRAAAGFGALSLLACAATFPPKTAGERLSPDAQAVLACLKALPDRQDKRVLSGQFAGHCQDAVWGFDHWVRRLHDATGRWPAMIGVDYGWYQGKTDVPDLHKANEPLKGYWGRGGLVTVSWHAPNPWTGGDAWDRSRTGSLREILTPGTDANARWMSDLNVVARGLGDLQEAGVVVLWRPFHEMNGAWFWWGGGDPEDFKALWRGTLDCLTGTKGLRNLLWVYAPALQQYEHIRPEDEFYPGDAFVDVLGLDVYDDNPDIKCYERMLALGKPFGFTEYGPAGRSALLRDYDCSSLIRLIRERYPRVCFFLFWAGGGLRDPSMVSQQNAGRLLSDPWVTTLDEVERRAASP
jgi:mannan endo-1,4-beta-mannosidase